MLTRYYNSVYSGAIDGNNQLIIKGKFNGAQIETVLRAYISEYNTVFLESIVDTCCYLL